MNELHEMQSAVVTIHNVARLIENKLGKGGVTEQLRQAADSLSSLIRYWPKDGVLYKDTNETV